jgi:5-methyltetrahydrofolate--homocysteine methyltransferase
MADFLSALRSGRVLLMDGAMGTELQRAGIGQGECYELWNLTHPDQVRAIHHSYAEAGAEVFLTNTFQANPAALARFALAAELDALALAALALARSVAGESGYVLYDVGPFSAEDRREAASCAVTLAQRGKADALLQETISDPADAASVRAACDQRGSSGTALPLLLSWTYHRAADGSLCTPRGDSPETCARQAEELHVAALGVNCGRDIGMDELLEILRRYRRVTDLPLFARPNAGTPGQVAGRWVYPRSAAQLAAQLPALLEAGVSMVGGCCGTTPEHIAAFCKVLSAFNSR